MDAYSELDMIDQMCAERGMVQNILLRINPGVEAHTHRFIQTAKTDSKFGFSVADGMAEKITQYALTKKHVHLAGYHCHIGSQIFEKQSFLLAVDKMMAFIAEIGKKYSFETEVLNLGGGYGIWYTDEDAKFSCADYADYLKAIIRELKAKSQEYGVRSPSS